ncbi:phosphatase PAP2 family protein [Deferrisoma camini]|uniref:phosphatase PAP2 family protein n=1 Tax=Deferrisoma camini TaxID=1035120 RepID=UPI00046CA80F|nr:phosphatase PAP2 family protein [Deferrisoma camini]
MRVSLLAVALALIMVSASSASAGVGRDPVRAGRDALAYAVTPAGWGAEEWGRFGLAAGAVAAVGVADEGVRVSVRDVRTGFTGDLARAVKGLGEPLGWGGAVVAATYLGGWAAGADDVRETGFRMAEAGVLSLAAASVLKVAAGRSRPGEGQGAGTFRPLRGGLGGGRSSFPSGHTTFAFAVAAVAAERVPGSGWVAYPLAALVGWSRLHDDDHWASDVAAGAALGAATGWWAAHRPDESAARLVPWVGPGGGGLAWAGEF